MLFWLDEIKLITKVMEISWDLTGKHLLPKLVPTKDGINNKREKEQTAVVSAFPPAKTRSDNDRAILLSHSFPTAA